MIYKIQDISFFKDLLNFYLNGRVTERREAEKVKERNRDFLQSLVHSPKGRNDQSWADPKPEDRNFLQISHVGAGSKGMGLPRPFAASSGCTQGAGLEVEPPGLQSVPKWDANTTAVGLASLQNIDFHLIICQI